MVLHSGWILCCWNKTCFKNRHLLRNESQEIQKTITDPEMLQQGVEAVKRRRWCTWLMWTTRGHLIIKACRADKQQMRCRPAGTSPSLIIISPRSEASGLHVRSQSLWMCEDIIQPWIHKQNNGSEGRREMGQRLSRGLMVLPSARTRRPGGCLSSRCSQEAQQTLGGKRDQEKSHSVSPTASFYFLSFSSDPAEICALYSFSTIPLLNSLTLLQPEGFLMNLGQHTCIKYAEDGIIGSEAEAEL